MKARYILVLFLFSLWGSCQAFAQTAKQAKALYEAGNYEETKEVAKKLLRAAPSNGNYNLWYGVSCLETGDAAEALKPLQTAVKRRVKSGKLHLARTYDALYRYDEAIETYEEYIEELEKLKRPTDEAEALLDKSRTNLRMLKGVEQVCVIDSFIVGKADFLNAYHLSPEAGTLYTYADYFKKNGHEGCTVYETELGNRLYYSEYLPSDSTTSILTSNKLLDQWSAGKPLPDMVNAARNTGYPYVLNDGVTIYYAADGAESLGGWDIFVTRYNTNTDSYLTPENLGMPFNSPANDYMYVVDEFNNLGWFASDRYQPADTVCIYVFIPTPSKQVYSYETTEHDKLVRLARLHAISDTWTAEDATTLQAARNRLTEAMTSPAPTPDKAKKEFSFVINDARTYHQTDDFRSTQARQAFQLYKERKKEFDQLETRLAQLREAYAEANDEQRRQQTPTIIEQEKRLEQLRTELHRQAKEIRRLESGNN